MRTLTGYFYAKEMTFGNESFRWRVALSVLMYDWVVSSIRRALSPKLSALKLCRAQGQVFRMSRLAHESGVQMVPPLRLLDPGRDTFQSPG